MFCGLVLGASTGEKKVCINFPHRKKRPPRENEVRWAFQHRRTPYSEDLKSVGLELAAAAPKKASKRNGVHKAKASTGKRRKTKSATGGGQRKDPPPEPLSPKTQGKATSALQAAIQSAVDADGTVDPVLFQTALDAGYSNHFVLDKVAAHLETLEDTKLTNSTAEFIASKPRRIRITLRHSKKRRLRIRFKGKYPGLTTAT